jgi:hypothetical protein
MKNAVIEKADNQLYVTLHPTPEKAVDHAVKLALENTGCNEGEIRDDISQSSGCEDGSYGVYVCEATEITD